MSLTTFTSPKDLSNLTIGDIISVRIVGDQVSFDSGSVQFSEPSEVSFLRVKNQSVSQDQVSWEAQVVKLGSFAIPPIKIGERFADPLNIKVVPLDQQPVREIQEQKLAQIPWYRTDVFAFGSMSALMSLVLIGCLIRKRPPKKSKLAIKDPVDPREEIFRRYVSSLENQNWAAVASELMAFTRYRISKAGGGDGISSSVSMTILKDKGLDDLACQLELLVEVQFGGKPWDRESAQKLWSAIAEAPL